MDVICFTLILVAIVAFYFYLTKTFSFWEKRGIPCVRNPLPGIGHLLPVIMQKRSYGDLGTDVYKEYDKHSIVGFYDLRSPALIIREPELAKTVLQLKFNNFHKTFVQVDPDLDPLLAKNPFFREGEDWITARRRLTYAFSAMRLKIISETTQLVCNKFGEYINNRLKNKEKYEVELKELFSRFTAEVVAHASMGIEGRCFEDKISKNSVLHLGYEMVKPSFWRGFVFMCVFFLPSLGKLLQVRFLPKHVDISFRNIVKEIFESRKKEITPRNDFFQLMMELEMKDGVKVNDEIMAAHVLSFFIDGFETSAITLVFVGYYLAANPHVQQKLREEIHTVLSKNDGAINYDSLKEMTYMNQVISESQRMQPVFSSLLKICTERTVLEGSDGVRCEVEPGTKIVLPILGLHMDEKYWPDPEKFDPDRFSDERKDEITKFTFLPFGEGPRSCVGMRMGLLQAKSAIAALLNKFSIELSPKTKEPLEIDPTYFLRLPTNGVWVYIKHLQE